MTGDLDAAATSSRADQRAGQLADPWRPGQFDAGLERTGGAEEAPGLDRQPTPPTSNGEHHRYEPNTKARIRSLWVFALAVVVVVAATWFSNAQSVEDIAIEGTIGVRTEAALSAAAVSQNRVAQAILLGRAASLDLATDEELQAALAAAATAIDELDRRVGQALPDLGSDAPAIEAAAADMAAQMRDALSFAASGDLESAEGELVDAELAFGTLAVDLADARDAALNDIVVARETAGQVAVGARMLVAFLIPMVTVLGYRFVIVRAARRRELQRELEAERSMLRAKDELIANISHELRTPLTGILGFSQEAALEESLAVEDLRMMAGVVAGEADELSRMVDDLITTARDKEDALGLAMEAVDPNQEMNAVRIPAVIAGRNISVDLPAILVKADRLRLRQILRNLVSNALKYGGPTVSLEGVVRDGMYHLSVVDDGDGVPAELEDRLFSRFVHQGDTPLMTGSVGLGLSIARRLAEIMGGTLSYSRSEGRTYFTLALPVANEAASVESQVA